MGCWTDPEWWGVRAFCFFCFSLSRSFLSFAGSHLFSLTCFLQVHVISCVSTFSSLLWMEITCSGWPQGCLSSACVSVTGCVTLLNRTSFLHLKKSKTMSTVIQNTFSLAVQPCGTEHRVSAAKLPPSSRLWWGQDHAFIHAFIYWCSPIKHLKLVIL